MSKTDDELTFTRDYVDVVDDVCVAMDAQMFKDMFGLMSALVLTEVQMEIIPAGLVVHQQEEAHIAMTIMFIPKQYFNRLKAGKQIKDLRIDCRDIKAILTKLKPGDIIWFTVVEPGKLRIEIKGKRTRTFNVPLFEPDKRRRNTPKIAFQTRVKTTMEGILIAIEDAQKLVAKGKKSPDKTLYAHIELITLPMGLHLKSSTESELYSSEATLTSGWDIMSYDGKAGVHVMISIPYIIGVIQAISKVTNMIQMEMSTDMPLHIIAQMPLKGVKLGYWFAPRLRVDQMKEVET